MARSKKGQSLVEYALGIGCVTAVCMLALGFLGHISGDIFQNVSNAINYQATDVTRPADQQPIVNTAAKPWVLE
jgi:hypothetical protein